MHTCASTTSYASESVINYHTIFGEYLEKIIDWSWLGLRSSPGTAGRKATLPEEISQARMGREVRYPSRNRSPQGLSPLDGHGARWGNDICRGKCGANGFRLDQQRYQHISSHLKTALKLTTTGGSFLTGVLILERRTGAIGPGPSPVTNGRWRIGRFVRGPEPPNMTV